MPFQDDAGPRPEDESHPFWRAFALVRDQLERVILLNMAWALQALPVFVAWAWPGLAPTVRYGLTLYTAVAVLPATGMLYAALTIMSTGQPLSRSVIVDSLKTQFGPSFLKLFPLYSVAGWAAGAALWAAAQGWLWLDVLARLGVLLLAVLSLYWGPALVARPDLSAWGLLQLSVRCFWRKPGLTLVMGLACVVALLLGVISLGGFFLIAPALGALLQIELYRSAAFRPGAAPAG